MKIIQLIVSNVQKIKAVQIDHPGDVVVIGGENAQGKTALLDSVDMALGGADAVPEMALRKGAEKGHVICRLADVDEGGNEIPETAIVVERRFTAKGPKKGTLTLCAADGTPQKAPQRMLETLIGRKAFDPLAFERMKPAEQHEALRRLVGLDLSGLERQREIAYDLRREENANVRRLQAQYDAKTLHKDAPEEEVSVAALTEELASAQALKDTADARVRTVTERTEAKTNLSRRLADLKTEIEQLRAVESEVAGHLAGVEGDLSRDLAAVTAAEFALIPLAPIRERLGGAEEVNQKVRENTERRRISGELSAAVDIASEYQRTLDRLDQEKREKIAAAEMPVEGLSLDAGQVLLNEVPLEQGSTAELRKLSIAMGFALNPKLPLVLIRDASLFDEANFQLVCEMTAERKGLLWMERVAVDGNTTIEIREGEVVEPADGARG